MYSQLHGKEGRHVLVTSVFLPKKKINQEIISWLIFLNYPI